MSKIQLHAQHYQSHRGDLLEMLNHKLQELDLIKKEVASASQTLVGHTTTAEPLIEDVEPQTDILNFQRAVDSVGQVASPPQEILDSPVPEEN